MKLLLRLSIIFCFFVMQQVAPATYVIRQPEPAATVVRAISYQLGLRSQDLQAIQTTHRDQIRALIDEAQEKKTGEERLRALQGLSTLNFPEPNVLRQIFLNMSTNIRTVLKTTVRIFDSLLPAINVLQNYFLLLEVLSTNDQDKLLFAQLRDTFLISLRMYAQEIYGQALYYRQTGNLPAEQNFMSIAQALIYRIKDYDPESLELYKQIAKEQPIPFEDELNAMGYAAIGGAQ